MQYWTNKRDYILFGKISMERRYWHYDEYGMRLESPVGMLRQLR